MQKTTKSNISFAASGNILSHVPKKYIIDLLQFAVSKTTKKNCSVCVVIVDDKEIKKINKKYRSKDKATTCLSFPLSLNGDYIINSMLGDIFINIDRIKKHSQDFKKELALNIIHSYLHLIGYLHTKENDANNMEKVEQKILRGFYGHS